MKNIALTELADLTHDLCTDEMDSIVGGRGRRRKKLPETVAAHLNGAPTPAQLAAESTKTKQEWIIEVSTEISLISTLASGPSVSYDWLYIV